MRYKGVTKFMAGLLAAAMVVTGIPVATLDTAEAKSKTEKLSYKGYTKVWEDNFDGNSLNMNDWNVETHEPGWVNAELQEYTESGNFKVSNGKLTIIPKRTKNADGTYSYTSGRINTQNKHDFKYGIMEAKMKFPKGQGYLPAFWMMPTNENLYGQWPKCGEIDIAEVMGQDTKKIYGTIHYGEPHAQSQGTEVLKKGDFSDEWHTCAVEWEPGSIKWYLDGVLYHEENQWFTKTPGQGEASYPAPFDQNFYIIFNLAIGGSWVGNPDKTTDYNSNFQVDYVKVYQKKNYNDNVKKPEKKVVLKKADKKGNFVSNADFSKNEKLDGSANWQFMTAQSGEGSAAIKNKKIEIKTKNAGKEEYSIQLVQPGLPMEKGATYEVSFDAYADKARTMKVDISGPDMNYMRYFNDTAVNLTTKKKSYKFKFTMNEDTDANSRLEFNMGAQGSTANVYITNVKVKKVKSATKAEADKKTVLADGNLVYNGKFQEGDKRLGYWNIKKKNASVAVSNKDYNDRKLVVKLTKDSKAADVKVYQTGLAFEANKEYSVSFAASATTARTIKVKVAGKTFNAKLNKATKNYEFIMKTGKKLTDKNVIFYLGGKKGTVCIDNVVVTENSLIKNGSFNAGTTGWTEWHDTSEADLSFVIDSLSEDNAADFTIKKTGSEDWKIQLKQENVPLEKDQYYKLTFKAKSSKTRKMRAIMQGLEDKGWAVYSGENTVKLTSKYKTYTKVFQMTADSDPKSQISFCLGAVAGKAINTQHRVCIDDVNLEIISEKEAKKYLGEGPKTQDSMIKDGTFVKGMEMWSEWHEAAEADAQYEVVDNAVHFTVNKTGSEDWKIQLKQENIKLEQGHYYKLTFKGKSDLERKVRATVQGGEARNYSHYTGDYFVTLKKDYQTYEHVFKMNEATDDKTSFQICMGAVGGAINKTHNMYFTDFSLVEISEEEGKKLAKNQSTMVVAGPSSSSPNPSGGGNPTPVKLTTYGDSDLQNGLVSPAGGSVTVTPKNKGNGVVQIAVKNNGASVANNAVIVPVAPASSITPNQTSKIKVNLNYINSATIARFSRARLMVAEAAPVVQFAVKDSSNKYHLLKQVNGTDSVSLNTIAGDVELVCDPLSVEQLTHAKIVCYAGALKNQSLYINSISKLEYKNTFGGLQDWETMINPGGNGTANATKTHTSNGVKFVINNPGSAAHHIQIGRQISTMDKGATYEYSFKAKTLEAGKTWSIKSCVQPGEGKKWYDSNTAASVMKHILITNEEKVVSKRFVAGEAETSADAVQFVLALGQDAGENVTPWTSDYGTVTVEVSDIRFVKVSDHALDPKEIKPGEAPTTPSEGAGEEPGTELIGNGSFDTDIAGVTKVCGFGDSNENIQHATEQDGHGGILKIKKTTEAVYNKDGECYETWNDQIKMDAVELASEKTYRLSFDIKTTDSECVFEYGIQKKDDGKVKKLQDSTQVISTEWKTIAKEFTMDATLDTAVYFFLGAVTKDSYVYIDNISLKEVASQAGDSPVNLLDEIKAETFWDNWCVYGNLKQEPNNVQVTDNQVVIGVTSCGALAETNLMRLGKEGDKGLNLASDKTYKLSFKVSSTVARKIKVRIVNASYKGYYNDIDVTTDEKEIVLDDIVLGDKASSSMKFHIMLGNCGDTDLGEHDVTIKDLVLVEKK